MFRSVVRTVLLMSLALPIAACGGDDDPAATAPTPTPTTVTETFSGTLERNFAFTHPFQTDAGTLQATVTALTPDSAAIVGIALGTWNGAACDRRVTNNRATQGTSVLGQASAPGALCVEVYDAAGLGQPTTYSVTVVHP